MNDTKHCSLKSEQLRSRRTERQFCRSGGAIARALFEDNSRNPASRPAPKHSSTHITLYLSVCVIFCIGAAVLISHPHIDLAPIVMSAASVTLQRDITTVTHPQPRALLATKLQHKQSSIAQASAY